MSSAVQPSARLEWLRAVIRQCSPAAIRVACEIEARWNHERGCSYPSVATLAHDCILSERSVQNGIQELSKLGFITVYRPENQGRNMANEYVPEWSMGRLGRVQNTAPIDQRRVQIPSKKGADFFQERVQEIAPQQGEFNKVNEQGGEREAPPLPPGDKNSQPPAATPEETKAKNREAMSRALRKAGLPTPPGAIEEWRDLLTGRGGCKTLAEVIEGVGWIARQASQEGATVTFAKHGAPWADRWAKILQDRRRADQAGAGAA